MGKQSLLRVSGLHAALETGEEILRGVDLTIQKGEVHVIMGPNGSGKSTLANTIMGSPVYHVTGGRIQLDGEDITEAAVDARAFLKTAKAARQDKPVKFFEFNDQLQNTLDTLQLDAAYAQRYLNVGFSGGEKKKSEILQLLTLNPKLAILDETDSGLDVDAVRVVTDGILRYKNRDNALLIISHSTRLLDELPVDYVHILSHGRFVHTGDRGLIDEISKNGFARFVRAEAR